MSPALTSSMPRDSGSSAAAEEPRRGPGFAGPLGTASTHVRLHVSRMSDNERSNVAGERPSLAAIASLE